jgi:hypothetical protein
LILALLTFSVFVLQGGVASAQGQGYRTLYRFHGGSDGWLPTSVPAVDKNGNLYGGTFDGGTYKWGTIFKLTAPRTRSGKWVKTVLYNFTGGNDGGYPSSLIFGNDGDLYGASYDHDRIFRMTPPQSRGGAWTYAVLYSLNETTDGSAIMGKLALDSAGNLYGATELGGDPGCAQEGCGTVFELKRPTIKNGKWQFKVLHTFTGTPDGGEPFAGVTFDQQGNLYGTTRGGGTNDWGAVYGLVPPKKNGQGWTESVIYSFDESNDDIISPEGPVAFDRSGNLFGTTPVGGDPNCYGNSCGVVFELTAPAQKDGIWTYSTLYAFEGSDGAEPEGYMVFDNQRNLYSTASQGGGGAGTAFRLSPPTGGGAWTATVLHHFPDNKKDGFDPAEGLTWGKWGDLYGVAPYGGINKCLEFDCGTVFELQP